MPESKVEFRMTSDHHACEVLIGEKVVGQLFYRPRQEGRLTVNAGGHFMDLPINALEAIINVYHEEKAKQSQ